MSMRDTVLNEYAEDFRFMEKTRVPDGETGFHAKYVEGETFPAAVKHDTTIQGRVAEQDKSISTYTFIVDKGTPLNYPDYIKRVRDGQIFQITSDADDQKTPDMSGLDMALVTARKAVLPS